MIKLAILFVLVALAWSILPSLAGTLARRLVERRGKRRPQGP